MNITVYMLSSFDCRNTAELTKLMSLGVKCGDTVTVAAEGPDEEAAAAAMQAFFAETL